MCIRIRIILTGLFLLCVSTAYTADLPTYVRGTGTMHGAAENFAKASGDTIDLMGPTGSGAPYLGDFEGGWNGWTSVDRTRPPETHWQVSNYNQAVGSNLAAWCGDISLEACNDSLDGVGGYGNNWSDLLAYRVSVSDPGTSATVGVTATLQHDTEEGYDFVYLSAKIEGTLGYVDVQAWDGKGTATVNNSVTILPGEFVGGTDAYILFRMQSDGGFSDADCSFYGMGACQLDDITVTVTQTGQPDLVSFEDFQDGTFGDWFTDLAVGVGDFAGLWTGLSDLDYCYTNFTQQVAFIDDGLVVPGTGGSECINWCYGPYGYIVNTTGGLAGPTSHLNNDILSPDMLWPNAAYDGILMSFEVYEHEDLSADAPGIFYNWGITSADTDNSAGNGFQTLDTESYRDRSFIYYGGPGYVRRTWNLTDLMNPGRDEIRIRLGVYELGWAWGWIGDDGYPAPYFDNVSVKVFPYAGPALSAREIELAQDNFPEIDAIDFDDLGSMHVRFDMARNISWNGHMRNDPGDSIVVRIAPVRTGAELVEWPEMHYTIDANPVFDPYRLVPVAGVVEGRHAISSTAVPIPDVFQFDLPDSGTLFPGDVLHYYFRAGDNVGGDIQYATLPGDVSGFGNFDDPMAYDTSFVVHALPTISSDGFGGYQTPQVLYWNDFAKGGGQAEWYQAWRDVGYQAGIDYDIYYTNGPSSGVGNGLGGRTGGEALAHYSELIYTAGDLSYNTLSDGDFDNDAGNDLEALLLWMSTGSKDIFLTGSNLASDLEFNNGALGTSFLETVMGLDLISDYIRPFIDNQTSPLVLAVPGNPVFQNVVDWIAYGGCPRPNNIDAVVALPGATRLAEFTDPAAHGGAYGYSAATINTYNPSNRIVSLPYDLMDVYTNPNKVGSPLADRTMILSDVLEYFGLYLGASPVPEANLFAVANYPNPFNPSTKISYVVPQAGHLCLKVFNVRGELVRTLIDGQVESSGHVMWDGANNQGGAAASGVYFYEARLGNEVQVKKMALIK